MVLLRCVGWSRDDILTFSDFGPNLLRTRKPNCVVDLYDARQNNHPLLARLGDRKLLQHLGGIRTPKLQPPRYSRLNNGPVGQELDKELLSPWSLDRVRKANEPYGSGVVRNSCRFQCSDRRLSL